MRKTVENHRIRSWITVLSKASEKNAKLGKRVLELASKPKRQGVGVNIKKLEKYAKENDNIVVPGKVLGIGSLSKKFSISAISYSAEAEAKLRHAKCEMLRIDEMLKRDNVRIII